MNILVTGANGQLGRELQRLVHTHFDLEPDRWYFTSRLGEDSPYGSTRALDVCDYKAVEKFIRGFDIDTIVNCAAYTNVDKAEKESDYCCEVNCRVPQRLADFANQYNLDFIHISTDYVFSGTNPVPYDEHDVTCPINQYGLSKEGGETYVYENCPRAAVIRTSWLYSAESEKNFVRTMIKLGKAKKQIGVVADQVGSPTYARDLAKLIFRMVDRGIIPGIYNFSNEGVCSWYDFAKAVHRIYGIENCKVVPLRTKEYKTEAKRPSYTVLDKTKVKQTYGIEIPHWEESLKDCIKEMRVKDAFEDGQHTAERLLSQMG